MNFSIFLQEINFFFHHHHHYHHIALVARISLTLSRHSSLSFIALGRSSGQHPVSSHSCWMYVRAGRPAFARPCRTTNTNIHSAALVFKLVVNYQIINFDEALNSKFTSGIFEVFKLGGFEEEPKTCKCFFYSLIKNWEVFY